MIKNYLIIIETVIGSYMRFSDKVEDNQLN